ncbi:MAG: hypothetical protein ACYCPA_08160 [Acidithiobacillus sp.]
MMEFSAGKQNWGYQFRFGIFAISDHDMNVIAAAMGANFMQSGQANGYFTTPNNF